MSSYAHANVCITNAKNKKKIPMRASHGLKWENKNVQAKKRYSKRRGGIVFTGVARNDTHAKHYIYLRTSPAAGHNLPLL